MEKLDADYWTDRYHNERTGWDAKTITTPLKHYFEQLTDKSLRVLVPGAGNAHEAGYLWDNGFKNVDILDWAAPPLQRFGERYPSFPKTQLVQRDFFALQGQYDLMIEQTFFCAIDPQLRRDYVRKTSELLAEGGKLVGLLWNSDFGDGPPFGGTVKEYKQLFDGYFTIDIMETCYNSIAPRAGREVFVKMTRKQSS
ncbi:MAG: SAM-dependent methyltransferase [Bacteroidota bacterium]